MRLRATALGAVVAAAFAVRSPPPLFGAEGGAAALVEKEFFAAIKSVTPASVYCVGKGGVPTISSGVVISANGYVLSDSAAGQIYRPSKGPRPVPEASFADEIEIRIPDLKRGTYAAYAAKAVLRVERIDATLLKITSPPPGGLAFVRPGTSDGLEIGQFTFAMGFVEGEGGTAALTAGIVAALVPAPAGQPGGRIEEIETSAAVNEGVNGGPLVDVDGNLVGIISTWGSPTPGNPFQFLGKAFPIDRIRHAFREVKDFATIFPDPKTIPPKARNAALLERAIALAARKAAPAVVSLDIVRSEPFRMRVAHPLVNPEAGLARYAGPVSGVSVSRDGWIVSSLYNFANTTVITYPYVGNDIASTLSKITSITVHYPGGPSVPARLVAHDQRLGVVCLKAELTAPFEAPVLETAPADALRVGRLLVNVGNPFGRARFADPLTTVGMLSRMHPDEDAEESAWRGCLQTDAGMTDGNCGGALVDVHGRLLALSMIWDPAGQGRESGIGFGIPWARIDAALPKLMTGTSYVYSTGILGVSLRSDDQGRAVHFAEVPPDGPAARAGAKVGDVVLAIDGRPMKASVEVYRAMRTRLPGEKVVVRVQRGAETLELTVELAKRPG